MNNRKGLAIFLEIQFVTLKLNTNRPAIHIQYYEKNMKGSRVTYVICIRLAAVATGPNKCVTNPCNYYVYQMATCIYERLYYRIRELFLEDVVLSDTFNHCTVLLYYDHSNLKDHSLESYHNDVMHNHGGICLP